MCLEDQDRYRYSAVRTYMYIYMYMYMYIDMRAYLRRQEVCRRASAHHSIGWAGVGVGVSLVIALRDFWRHPSREREKKRAWRTKAS